MSPRMPDFAHSHYGFHHSVDSALETLYQLGIPASRITIRKDGLGLPDGWVIEQFPTPGGALSPDVTVRLTVAGLGFFHQLPVGMWDRGGEEQPGTKEILEILDDPLEKASHAIREGARLYAIHPNDPPACSRWIVLFGLTPGNWPVASWYRLALLLPTLHRMAGTEAGIQLALGLLLGLPVLEIRRRPSFLLLEQSEISLLGARHGALGVDLVLGNRVEDLAELRVVVGPVAMSTYRQFEADEHKARLHSVLELCMACYQRYSVSWVVLDPGEAPRLGDREGNAWLGINTHLGRRRPLDLAAETGTQQ